MAESLPAPHPTSNSPGGAHAAADAHGDHHVARAAALAFDEGVAGQAGAAHAEGVADRYGALFVLVTPTGAVLIAQIALVISQDGETAFAAICFTVG